VWVSLCVGVPYRWPLGLPSTPPRAPGAILRLEELERLKAMATVKGWGPRGAEGLGWGGGGGRRRWFDGPTYCRKYGGKYGERKVIIFF